MLTLEFGKYRPNRLSLARWSFQVKSEENLEAGLVDVVNSICGKNGRLRVEDFTEHHAVIRDEYHNSIGDFVRLNDCGHIIALPNKEIVLFYDELSKKYTVTQFVSDENKELFLNKKKKFY